MTTLQAWLIILLPLTSFVLIGLGLHRYHRLSAGVTLAAIGGSLLLSLRALQAVLQAQDHLVPLASLTWLSVYDLRIDLTLTLDSLTAVMLIVVTSVSLLVQVYSTAYMHGEEGYGRFFAEMSLFTASMLGLVLADNLLLLYAFWELVGLCSYLLIGFWYQRPAAAAAAKKAFVVTRFGDFGFLIAILLLYANNPEGTLSISTLAAMANEGVLKGALLTWAALGIFSGAVGKSGQFPLHVWLPDAMEGPTPVSALIHAATMVAAGVYLVARTFPLFAAAPDALGTVALIGGFTAFFAATMGLVATDIKRVLAYSTISQLGYMMLALGVGAYAAAAFHLLNHAFFKALLFLGSGSIYHAVETYDLRFMGGLRRAMPITFTTFVIAALAIAGIPPLSGFWSKDEILTETLLSGNLPLFLLALAAALMTAFYMFRLVFLAFAGESRAVPGAHARHPHESPWLMTLPLALLAVPSVLSGFLNPIRELAPLTGLAPHALSNLLGAPPLVHDALSRAGHATAAFNPTVALLSTAVAVAGILLAWAMYGARFLSAEALGRGLAPVYRTLISKYWIDELYQAIVNWFVLGLGRLLHWFDANVVDGIVNAAGRLPIGVGGALRYAQSGQAQAYGLAFLAGVIVLLAAFLIRGV